MHLASLVGPGRVSFYVAWADFRAQIYDVKATQMVARMTDGMGLCNPQIMGFGVWYGKLS